MIRCEVVAKVFVLVTRGSVLKCISTRCQRGFLHFAKQRLRNAFLHKLNAKLNKTMNVKRVQALPLRSVMPLASTSCILKSPRCQTCVVGMDVKRVQALIQV